MRMSPVARTSHISLPILHSPTSHQAFQVSRFHGVHDVAVEHEPRAESPQRQLSVAFVLQRHGLSFRRRRFHLVDEIGLIP
jgi:hypothetical protein